MRYSRYWLVLLFSLLVALPSARAELFAPTAQDITEPEAQRLFLDLKKEESKMDKNSECFQRAHIWSLRAEKLHGIRMEKVFTFFTYKFKMRHLVTSFWGKPFTWWFHVAPAVRVNGALWVMDATFTDKAMPVQEWARSLMLNPEDCQEMPDYSTYVEDRNSSEGYRHVERAKKQCYYVATPPFIYQPNQVGFQEIKGGIMRWNAPEQPPTQWIPLTIGWAAQSYTRPYRSMALQELGF